MFSFETFSSVVGVLKSILQILVGIFAFDRLALNGNTLTGILLSLIAGTMFSYFEYKRKNSKNGTGATTKSFNPSEQNLEHLSAYSEDAKSNSESLFIFNPIRTRASLEKKQLYSFNTLNRYLFLNIFPKPFNFIYLFCFSLKTWKQTQCVDVLIIILTNFS